jgi:cell division protein FtsI (penicillin-binding protein 3)
LNKYRAIILNTAIIFGFFAVFFRLSELMIVNHGLFSEKAKSQQIKAEDIQVRRGGIYDRKGRDLAVNIELESLYANPEEIAIERKRMNSLSIILGMKPKAIQAKISSDKRFAWVYRKLTQDKATKIREMNIKGFGFIPEAKRFYPKGELASHVIGAVGLDNQALEGIEHKYDSYLKASGGKVYFSRDASGRMLSSGVNMESKGHDILLTIDEGLQYIVEKELKKAMSSWNAVASSAIMMNPFTGEILALANSPAFDPNEIGRADRNAIRNRVITDIYEPGSTFKLVVGAAALEEKIFDLNSTFDTSSGSIVVGGKVIRDAHKHDVLTFREVIKKSSNVGSIMIGKELGKKRLYKYAKLFGFGEQTGIDLPGEVPGWIRRPEKWSATSIGAISIGQEVAVTPLQILIAYSAIANGGYIVQPYIVSEIRDPEGDVSFFFKQKAKRVISKKAAIKFKEVLKTVVEEGGTGKNAAIDGNQVAGKTGTAQLIDSKTKRYSRERFISSFVGFVPADNPKIALIVVIYEPKEQMFGGVVAAPVFRRIVDQSLSYMNVPREGSPLDNLLLVSK